MKNMNEIAIEVSKREGGKKNLSIAQIKEVLRHVCDMTAEEEKKSNGKPFKSIWTIFRHNGRRRLGTKKRKK